MALTGMGKAKQAVADGRPPAHLDHFDKRRDGFGKLAPFDLNNPKILPSLPIARPLSSG